MAISSRDASIAAIGRLHRARRGKYRSATVATPIEFIQLVLESAKHFKQHVSAGIPAVGRIVPPLIGVKREAFCAVIHAGVQTGRPKPTDVRPRSWKIQSPGLRLAEFEGRRAVGI